MFNCQNFTVINELKRIHTWSATLAKLFGYCRELVGCMNLEIAAGQLSKQTCLFGKLPQGTTKDGLCLADLVRLGENYSVEMVSPFENVASISGGIWPGTSVVGEGLADAALRLHFEANTNNLPLHSHDYSDRAILVLDGNAMFHTAKLGKCSQTPTCIQSVEISQGDVLVFSRGTIHTFETAASDLLLFSYHGPFIDLEDPRQYTVCEGLSLPKRAAAIRSGEAENFQKTS